MHTVRKTDIGSKPTRNREHRVQKLRLGVQIAFALLCVWIGIQFHYFVRYLESGGTAAFVARPPGVDGFLPISSLMNLYYFVLSGQVHPFHPAGLFILAAVLLMSLVFGKAFCSWLCPVGFVSEMLGDLGARLMRRRPRLPRWLDYPLRSLKYLLLAFFAYSIFFLMNEVALKAFLDSPYNLVSDIKMYYFFADISAFALIVIAALFGLSIFVRNFWCRYLCPYGALLGITSLLSPTRIRRDPVSCIDCGKCARACPSHIPVDRITTVVSDECTTCLSCVDVCPIAATLQLQVQGTRRVIRPRWVAIGVVGIFVAVTGLAILTGHWQNDVSRQEYLSRQGDVRNYSHPMGTGEISRLKSTPPPADNRP